MSAQACLYSDKGQSLGAASAANDMVLLDKQKQVSGFDVSSAASNGALKAQAAGMYAIHWKAQGQLNPPNAANPIAFGLFLNGAYVPGSIGVDYQNGNPAAPEEAHGHMILAMNAGDSLVLKNLSSSPVNLQAAVPSVAQPVNSASLCVYQL